MIYQKSSQISQNDDVILEQRTNPNLTIEKLNQIIVEPKIDINHKEASWKIWGTFKNSLTKDE
ncbi:MAG: hypothetical protein IPF43_00895 [Arcobacter sp.]|nr:hypothetical protein [Arcobacter sp.]